MLKNVLFIILLTIGWNSLASTYGSKPLDQFFFQLMNLDYSSARITASSFKDPTLRPEALQLVNVLELAGQEPIKLLAAGGAKQSSLVQAISALSYGYQELYTSVYSSKPFSDFKRAFSLAEEIQNIPLKKLSLLAILEVFHFQVVLANDEYESYLNTFKSLIVDKSDSYWFKIHEIHFILQNVNETNIPTDFFESFEVLMNQFSEKHKFWPNYLSKRAIYLEVLKQQEKAKEMHLQAISYISKEPFLKYIKFRSFIRISEISRRQNEPARALSYLDSASVYIDKANTLKGNYYIHYYASRNHYLLGDYKKAFEASDSAIIASVKLDYQKNSLELGQLNVKYQTNEKDKQLLISEQKEKQNRNIAYGLGGSLLSVSLIAFLLFKNTKKKQRIAEQEKELEIQKTEKILKEQELTTIDAMIEGQEKERQRLASDLHDSVGATLSAARLQFDHISKNKDNLGKLNELFEKTGSLLDDAYNEVRSMAHLKNSGVIAKNGLLPAVEKLAKNASGTNKLKVEVEDFGLEDRLENTLEITIFRIIQELVTNVIKHANASEATISITQHQDSLNIIVEDNGKGFDAQKFQQKEGMGLSGIERRIEHLEGTLEVDSTLGKGTSVLIDIPL